LTLNHVPLRQSRMAPICPASGAQRTARECRRRRHPSGAVEPGPLLQENFPPTERMKLKVRAAPFYFFNNFTALSTSIKPNLRQVCQNSRAGWCNWMQTQAF